MAGTRNVVVWYWVMEVWDTWLRQWKPSCIWLRWWRSLRRRQTADGMTSASWKTVHSCYRSGPRPSKPIVQNQIFFIILVVIIWDISWFGFHFSFLSFKIIFTYPISTSLSWFSSIIRFLHFESVTLDSHNCLESQFSLFHLITETFETDFIVRIMNIIINLQHHLMNCCCCCQQLWEWGAS